MIMNNSKTNLRQTKCGTIVQSEPERNRKTKSIILVYLVRDSLYSECEVCMNIVETSQMIDTFLSFKMF